MKLTDVEFHAVESPHQGRQGTTRVVVAVLTDDSGRQGFGEAPLRWRSSELGERRKLLLASLAGRSVADVEELIRLPAVGSNLLAAALETASWDLLGRTWRAPLCWLLGGAWRMRAPLAVRLARRSASELAQLADDLVGRGHQTLVLSASGDVKLDSSAALAVLQVCGARAALQLDGAGRFTPESAAALCSSLPDDSLSVFFDPLPPKDVEGLTALSRKVVTPLGAAAGIRSSADVLSIARRGVVSHIALDLYQVGGVSALRRCAAVAEAAGMHVALRAEPSLGVGLATILQVVAATPICEAVQLGDDHFAREEIGLDPIAMRGSMAVTPSAPGLGIQVDPLKLESLASSW